uniref:Uncharacterized protein n=1 Tax=Lutzomyia longipalpis TaxID=7200 RepID=A0A1B0CI69_LUTLO
YDDDDDLESLRLAALQTLNPNRKPASNPIQVLESAATHHKPRYEEEMYAEALPGAPFPVPERLDVVFGAPAATNGQWQSPNEVNPPPYVPPYVAPGAPTDVQLSPRSAAFVLQNTSILRRRKGDKSPSVSPPPYKSALAAPWEPPSPEYHSRVHSRSRTPSPERVPSPVYRHRSPPSPKRFYSRSPPRRERSLTRSPPPPRRRTRSRSPLVRRPSPRFAPRSRNASPRPPRSRRQSPRISPPVRRKQPSRSPVRVTRHRSQSPKRAKSPVRKPRRPRDGPPPPRRRSPERKPRGQNDRRPRNPPRDTKDDKRPSPRPRRRSRTRSPEKASHTPPMEPKGQEKKPEDLPEKRKSEREVQENPPDKPQEEKKRRSVSPEKEKNDEEAQSSDGEEDAADGIDLFASDESESENEGRFKSSSSKSERPAQATVSFSKLVTEPVATLTELKDLPALSNVGSGASRDRRGRERNSREYSRSRRKRDRDRRSQRPRDSGKSKEAEKDSRTKVGGSGNSSKGHGESNMKMFKSTFQAVIVNDSKRQQADPAPTDGGNEKGSSKDADKRKIIQIKKPISFKETKEKGEAEGVTNGQSSSSVGGSSVEGKVKKSIHLRLGGYATPNGEPSSSSLSSVLTSSSKSLKSGNLANLKKSWKTSEKVPMKYCLMILSLLVSHKQSCLIIKRGTEKKSSLLTHTDTLP